MNIRIFLYPNQSGNLSLKSQGHIKSSLFGTSKGIWSMLINHTNVYDAFSVSLNQDFLL